MMVASSERETVAPAAVGDDGTPSTAAGSEAVSGSVDEYIGSRLRQAFDAVAQQPVPDRFLELMAALDKG